MYMEYAKQSVRKHSFILFFAVFGLVVLVVYGVFGEKEKTPSSLETRAVSGESPVSERSINLEEYIEKIKNTSIIVPETTTRISLVDGRASYGTLLDGGDVAFVKLIGGIPIDAEVSHIFADIVVQSGGTGAFHYICIFEVSGSRIEYLSSYFIGDRVNVSSAVATVKNSRSYDLQVTYLDRSVDQAMSEDPTIEKIMYMSVKNGVFVEETL